MNRLQTKYLIIGSGLSGLSAAYHVEDDYILTESTDSVGGTAGTLNYKNFKLDNAVHILYFKNKEILDWICNTLKVSLLEKIRENSIWIENNYIRFPIQYHLADLPLLSRFYSFTSICKTLNFKKKNSFYKNFEEYSLRVFGNYLTDVFIRPYNEKLFGIQLADMTTEWMGDYVPEYSKAKMILSITKLMNSKYGRNSKFYYPIDGGISTIAKRICEKLKLPPHQNYSLLKVFLDRKTAVFSNGVEINYKYLINTIALNIFLEKIDDLPDNILNCIGLMKSNSTTILHILVKGNVNHNYYHWVYVPSKEIPFYRITFPGNINPVNCPKGFSAITLEFGGDVYKNDIIAISSIRALERMGILNESIIDIDLCWRLLDCGYVIYDQNRDRMLKTIFSFLQNYQVWSIGRYGSWEYSNMEDAIIHGKKVAEQLKI